MKKMKTERESASHLLILPLYFAFKYLMTQMITKRSKSYVLYLYTRIKYESITVDFKNKTGKGTLHFK